MAKATKVDFERWEEQAKKFTDSELAFALVDAEAARDVAEENAKGCAVGTRAWNEAHEAAGRYADEAYIYRQEAGRRQGETTRVAQLRKILAEHTAALVDGSLVDVTTASVILKVYDALNEENRAKYATMRVQAMAELAWEMVK